MALNDVGANDLLADAITLAWATDQAVSQMAGLPPEMAAVPGLQAAMIAALTAQQKPLVRAIVEGVMTYIVTNAIVSPVGVPPMSNSGGPVAGAGKVV